MNPTQVARWLALGAGALDGAMGGSLLVAPAFTLQTMGLLARGAGRHD